MAYNGDVWNDLKKELTRKLGNAPKEGILIGLNLHSDYVRVQTNRFDS
jgi:hypothetical protein